MSSRKDNEEPLKALVFADGCGASPIHDFPCTAHLLNVPVLSWQLGTLARYGVKEAIVLSSEPIEDLYEDPLRGMKVTPLSSSSWAGEGDAIRDVESRDGMRPVDDFVLVRQGAVFNVDVAKLVAAHKRRKDADRNWLITTVFRKGAGPASTGLILGVDKLSGTLVKYLETPEESGISIDVTAENAGLQGGGTLEICTDVVDVGLDVCAPEFLLEFRENFYYDRVRAYIKEKLEGGEAEVFGNRMFAHYVDSSIGQYGTRIHSLASLVQATSDALGGWLSPITPALIKGMVSDEKVPGFHSEFLLEQSALGEDASIAVGSTIIDSVIGKGVKIGSDVTIRQSIIMDETEIRDRCEIDGSVIEAKCVIEDSSAIPRNCYLEGGVSIGPDFQSMAPYSLISAQAADRFRVGDEEGDHDDNGDELRGNGSDGQPGQIGSDSEQVNGVGDIESQDPAGPGNPEHVGRGGRGWLIPSALASRVDPYFVPFRELFDPYLYESEEEDELEEEEEEEQRRSADGRTRHENGEIDDLTENLEEATMRDGIVDDGDTEGSRIFKFNEEVLETMDRAYSEDVEVENTALEINSLKLVYHCTFAETLTGVVAGLAQTVEKASAGEQLYGEIDKALEKYNSIVTKFSKGQEPIHHLHVATGLASALNGDGRLLMYVFKAMYEKDMLEEEGILGWGTEEEKRIEAGKGNEALLKTVEPLLDWLEDAEEEED